VRGPRRPSAAALATAGLTAAAAYFAAARLIAFDRFHAPLQAAAVPIMLLYWLGQRGIAASCAVQAPAARRDETGAGRGAGDMLHPG
jgi:hypothetical protein